MNELIFPQKMKDGVPVFRNGLPVLRVRMKDPVTGTWVERLGYGQQDAERVYAEMMLAKTAPIRRRIVAQHVRLADTVDDFLIAYATDKYGDPRPFSTWAKAASLLNQHVKHGALGREYLSNVRAKVIDEAVRDLRKRNGQPLSRGSRQTVSNVIKSLCWWLEYENITPINISIGCETGWGAQNNSRRLLVPCIPTVFRLARHLDDCSRRHDQGDVGTVLGLVGLRWEELAGMPRGNVDLTGERGDGTPTMLIDRICTESGGRRELRILRGKSAAALRTVVIPELALPAVRRLLDRHADQAAAAPAPPARHPRQDDEAYFTSPEYVEWYESTPWVRLVNNRKGGFASYGAWRKVLVAAQEASAADPEGMVVYTAHQLRHVAASLLIASGASKYEVQNQMGHASVATTEKIYQHLFKEDRAALWAKINAKANTLYVVEDSIDRGREAA